MTGVLLCGAAQFAALPPAHAQTLRPQVGKPLEKAEALAKEGKFPDAIAQLDEADAVRNKTPEESFVITEMRASIAQQSGDFKSAIAADNALIATGKVGRDEQQQLLMAEASSYYQLKDYPGAVGAITRYYQAGGSSPAIEQLLIQCYYLQRDYAHAAEVQRRQVDREIKAGQAPAEAQLQLLANCQLQTGNQKGLADTMVELVTYYPKPEYWAQLLHGLRANPNVPDRLQFDIDRLRLAVGLLTSANDFMDMAELGVQAGLPNQALAAMNQGYATGALGRGAQADREGRLKALVEKTIAAKKASIAADEASAKSMKDGNALLGVGYSYVDLGQYQHGIELMKQAIAKDSLVAPEDAQLHLGLAYMMAGDKAQALATLKSVGGTDGAAQLAQLWILRLGKS